MHDLVSSISLTNVVSYMLRYHACMCLQCTHILNHLNRAHYHFHTNNSCHHTKLKKIISPCHARSIRLPIYISPETWCKKILSSLHFLSLFTHFLRNTLTLTLSALFSQWQATRQYNTEIITRLFVQT